MEFPAAGEKWYMAGTDGSGKYLVVADGEFGRIGYREIKPEVYRVRFEPNTDDTEVMTKIQGTLKHWCPPQSGIGNDTFRFSILANGKSALRCGVDMGIKAMGSFGSFNPVAPDWLTSLIDKPFDITKEPVGKPLQNDGFWIGKEYSGTAASMFATWKLKKDTSFEPEEEPEEETSEEEESEEESSPDSFKYKYKGKLEPSEYDEETLMGWIAEDAPMGAEEFAYTSKGTRHPLTTALYHICRAEAKKNGQSWNLGCTCGPCLRATKIALKVYEQAKLDYAKKKEAERPLTPEEQKEQAVAQAAEMAKAAMNLADTLKAFGF